MEEQKTLSVLVIPLMLSVFTKNRRVTQQTVKPRHVQDVPNNYLYVYCLAFK